MEADKHSHLRTYAGTGDKVLIFLIYFVLVLTMQVIILPLINVVASSFSNPKSISIGAVTLWPKGFTLIGYETVFRSKSIGRGFTNSLIYTVLGTLFNVTMTILAAYPLSRRDLPGRRWIMFMFTLTMFIGGGLIPSYMLINQLGLLNTRAVMIIGGAAAWNIIICRTFFNLNVPEDLLQAAQIDGCDDFTFVRKIVLNLARPIIAVQILQFAVGIWNSYFGAMIYLTDNALYPLQVVLRNILILSEMTTDMKNAQKVAAFADAKYLSYVLKYSLIVISSIPVLALYPFIQKYFIKGMLIGSLKM